MGRDRPHIRCFAAPVLPDGRVRGVPLVVSLADAEWLWRARGWCIVGPDPSDMMDLATWEREQEPLPIST